MENKKNDMYNMANRYRQNGWRRVDIQADFNAEPEPEPEMEMEIPRLDIPRHAEMPINITTAEIPMKNIMQAEIPMESFMQAEIPTENPEDNACGFCITPAMSYVPMQMWNSTYEPEIGFTRGTIFPELDLPWVGEGACDDDR